MVKLTGNRFWLYLKKLKMILKKKKLILSILFKNFIFLHTDRRYVNNINYD